MTIGPSLDSRANLRESLRAYMKARDITQSELASQTGISQALLSRILSGKAGELSLSTLRKLADLLLVTPEHFTPEIVGHDASRVHFVDRMMDVHIVYQNDQYVCLQKLFPLCQYEEEVPADDYRRFHLRFYIPREYLTDASRKADRAIIMTNGLDEISNFTLYDELGSRLASRGLVAILLPLPDHLNRHTRFGKATPTLKQIVQKPSEILLEEPSRLYQRYLQFREELVQLLSHIKGNHCGNPDDTCSFYEQLFEPHVRVSCLGYSLGASAMMCAFVEREEELNACFLLSGTTNLRHILSAKLVPQREWDVFIKGVQDYFSQHTKETLADRLFVEVFLGQSIDVSSALLREHGRRVLFIYGGRDQIIDYHALEAISPQGLGLGMVVLPGINHFLAIDEEWKQWIALVVNLITEYEQNALRHTITKEVILRQYKGAKDDRIQVVGKKGLDARLVLTRGSLVGLEPSQLAAEEAEKKATKERIKTCSFEELRIGEMLYKIDLIAFSQLAEALRIQESRSSTGQWKKLGDILVEELGAVRRHHLETVAGAGDCP